MFYSLNFSVFVVPDAKGPPAVRFMQLLQVNSYTKLVHKSFPGDRLASFVNLVLTCLGQLSLRSESNLGQVLKKLLDQHDEDCRLAKLRESFAAEETKKRKILENSVEIRIQ